MFIWPLTRNTSLAGNSYSVGLWGLSYSDCLASNQSNQSIHVDQTNDLALSWLEEDGPQYWPLCLPPEIVSVPHSRHGSQLSAAKADQSQVRNAARCWSVQLPLRPVRVCLCVLLVSLQLHAGNPDPTVYRVWAETPPSVLTNVAVGELTSPIQQR